MLMYRMTGYTGYNKYSNYKDDITRLRYNILVDDRMIMRIPLYTVQYNNVRIFMLMY